MDSTDASLDQIETMVADDSLDEECNEETLSEENAIRQLHEAIAKQQTSTDIFSKLADDTVKLNVIQAPCDDNDGVSGNALNIALRKGNCDLAYGILHTLNQMPDDKSLVPLRANNSESSNTLQVFLNSMVQQKNKQQADVIENQVWERLKKMIEEENKENAEILIMNKNAKGQTAVSFAVFCPSVLFGQLSVLKFLFSMLPEASKIEAIKQLHMCNCDDLDGEPMNEPADHKEKCTESYNLLMLALSAGVPENTEHILEIVNQSSIANRYEIFIGENKPKHYTTRPNSLRVAAMYGYTFRLEPWLAVCNTEKVSALLEVDERLGSALGHFLRGDNLDELKKLLSDGNVKQQFRDALRNKKLQNVFAGMEMSVDAIRCFKKADIYFHSYIVPSQGFGVDKMSYPEALIYYNTFEYDKKRKRKQTKCAARKLKKALLDIGWPEGAIRLERHWTFEALLDDILERVWEMNERNCTSLLLLCVTSHGGNEKIAGVSEAASKITCNISDKDSECECSDEDESMDDKTGEDQNHLCTMGTINELLDHVVPLLEDIPKVVIMDICRKVKSKKETKIFEPDCEDTMVLMGSSLGSSAQAGLYLGKLAEQIAKADGSTTLYDMHSKAAAEVMKINPGQIPEISVRGAKDMKLPNWTKKSSHKLVCCSPGCQTKYIQAEVEYITCGRCVRIYHLDCTNLVADDLPTLAKAGMKWLCEPCRSLNA